MPFEPTREWSREKPSNDYSHSVYFDHAELGRSDDPAGKSRRTRCYAIFSGLWDQPKQESQGIVLQIIDQEEGGYKKAVAYWFTYGDNLDTAWYMAIGHVEGDQVLMNLYTAEGVAFMEDDAPGNDNVYAVGILNLSFKNCNFGMASYDFADDQGSGEFEIKRLAGLYNSRCSGGISDDTPSNAKPLMLDVNLGPAREGITGKGKAGFSAPTKRRRFRADAAFAIRRCLTCWKPRAGVAPSA